MKVRLPEQLRLTHITDEVPIPSFFIRYRDPVECLTRNWNYARTIDFQLAERLIADAGVLMVQRAFTPESKLLVENAKRNNIPVLYETDDFMLALPPESTCQLSGDRKAAVRQMLKRADLVTCSTKPLAEQLSEYNKNTSLLENYAIPFDPQAVRLARIGPPHVAVVNTDYFKLVKAKNELFESLRYAIRALNYRITFFGSVDACMEDLRTRFPKNVTIFTSFIPWRKAFLTHLMNRKVNVAIVPLENNSHHKFKSDIKFLDFASLGIPGIYNNPEIYHRVAHRDNGFLCDGTYQGWVDGLTYFANSSARRNCGDAAYNQACERTIEHYAEELGSAILRLAS